MGDRLIRCVLAASLVVGVPLGSALATPAGATHAPNAGVVSAAPSKPIEVSARGYHRQVELTWSTPATDGGEPITAYRVQRSTNGSTWTTLTTSASVGRRFVARGLVNGTKYFFRVAAINADGRGANSNIATARPRPVPGAPRRFRARPGDDTVTLRWRAPRPNGTPPISGYRVQMRPQGGSWTTVTTVARSVRRFVASTDNGTTTDHRVVPVNSRGAGRPSPIRRVSPPTTLDVSLGATHTCAILPSRTGRCWGLNSSGQLADPDAGSTARTPTATVGGATDPSTGIRQVEAGGNHTCIRIRGGAVLCAGRNDEGQLGDGSVVDESDAPTPVVSTDSSPLVGVVDLAAGRSSSCAVLADTTVRCWGRGDKGQIGDGTTGIDRRRATTVVESGGGVLEAIAQVSVGSEHACATRTTGTTVCWGDNSEGQNGSGFIGGSTDTPSTVRVSLLNVLRGVTEVGAGSRFSCALISDGTVRCWGDNTWGQLGDDDIGDDSALAVPVVGPAGTGRLDDVVDITVGTGHACALRSDRTAWCWGNNGSGELGTGTPGGSSDVPVLVTADGTTPLPGVEQIEAGLAATCARLGNGTLVCWGSNEDGGLGDGTANPNPIPTRPIGL